MEEFVLGDDFLREYRQADFHILLTPHGGVLIKIINVKSDEAGTGVEIVLFKMHLVVVKLAQLMVVSPDKSNLLPLTVTRRRCVSVLWGRMLATSRE